MVPPARLLPLDSSEGGDGVPNWGELLGKEEGLPPPDVPGYTILELIGGHGQSEVYLATDASGRQVALKRWKLPSARAQLELEALQSLRVPGVVEVLGSAEDRALGLPCLIMEFVAAPELLADSARLEPRAAAAVVRDVARTLVAVHAQDLVHRDIKPANILLRENGSVVLVDFGVVKAGRDSLHPEPMTLTGAGPIGTLPYMAPEQLDLLEDSGGLDDPVGPQADVYGLGATLYQCLTGVVPFETNGAFERRERKVWRDPPAGALTEGIPPQLRRVVSACLAFRPQDRPAGVQAVAQALDDYLAGRSDRRWGLWVLAGLLVVVGAAAAASQARGGWAQSPVPRASEAASPSPSPDASPTLVAELRELVLQPGPRRGRDTYVSSVGLYSNDNFGPAPSIRVGFRGAQTGQSGEYRGLIAFDLERVPPSAELVGADLELWVRGPGFGPGPSRVEARAVIASGARTPWVEGTGRNDRLLDGVAWKGVARTRHPAASSNAPQRTKPDTSPSGSVAYVQSGHFGWVQFEVGESVRAWLAEPDSNFGLEISARGSQSAGHWQFASSDFSTADQRPRLRLRYRGLAPRPAVALDHKAARVKAEVWLEKAASALLAGDRPAAYEALTVAASEAPAWGRPYYERAELAVGLGLGSMVRVDALQSLYAAIPERRVQALWLLARANLNEQGLTSQVLGLALLVALSCDAEVGGAAAELFLRALPRVAARTNLAAPGLRFRAARELEALIEARVRGRAREPAPGSESPALFLGLALVYEALGDARALGAYQEARQVAPLDPAVLALTAPRQRARPRALAARIRAHVLLGLRARARRLWEQARVRWPKDASLGDLRPLVERD